MATKTPKMRSRWEGGCCLQIEMESPLKASLFRRLEAVASTLRGRSIADGSVSAYAGLAAYWRTPPAQPKRVEAQVRELIDEIWTGALSDECSPKQHCVPTRYGGEDLERVARHNQLEEQEVVQRHNTASYVVAAVGFVPHFAYLWGLDETLATPRLEQPRVVVPLGSLGIGGGQTGIYPRAVPGGWNLIGTVDVDWVASHCPTMRVGDEVTFEEVGC